MCYIKIHIKLNYIKIAKRYWKIGSFNYNSVIWHIQKFQLSLTFIVFHNIDGSIFYPNGRYYI